MKQWAAYAAVSALLLAVSALLVSSFFDSQVETGIFAGLVAAWLVQAVAFALLVAASRRPAQRLLMGWTAGTALRLAALAALAWLSLAGVWSLPTEPTLIALVAALFVLLLLEPVVLRLGTR